MELRAPHIHMTALPAAEQGHARALHSCLSSMCSMARDFEMAIGLFDHAQAFLERSQQGKQDAMKHPMGHALYMQHVAEMEAPNSWQMFAARIGAIAIYGIVMMMDAAKENARRCPTLKSDLKAATAASKAMKAAFSGWYGARQAAVHFGELTKSPGDVKDNAQTSAHDRHGIKKHAGSSLMVGCGLTDRTFHGNYRKNMYEYDLTVETLQKLQGFIHQFYQAFAVDHGFPAKRPLAQ